MFSNFKESFKKSDGHIIPKEIVESLNKRLPNGLIYKRVAKDLVFAVPSEGREMQMSANIKIPESLRIYKPGQLFEILYRTQTGLKIDKNVPVKINGIEIALDEAALAPLITSKNTEFFLQPRPFPSPYELEFSGNGHTRTLTMQRQPLADLNKTLLKNIDNDGLQVSMKVLEDTETLRFSFNFNLQKVDSIDELLSVLFVYQAFIQGEGQVVGLKLPPAPTSDVERETLNDLLTFWNKMSSVEKKLGVQFPLDLPLSDEEDIWLMKLYSSFVKEEPFRENIKYTSITFDPPENFDKDRLISQAAGFTFLQSENINLLGVDLELFAVMGVYNLRISDIIPSKKEPGKLECILENKSDQKSFRSMRYFKTYEEALEFQKNIRALHEARDLFSIFEEDK
ncbi:abortive infection system toxin AbiGii family protein [Paenibacillus amylolyticus]|uniref:abortive infection system toxin AbiGii family protein n=1 Tax=Paenibacillus sp. PK1-4R TaxID=3049075 RepID=UPI0025A148E1|nr:abortive infection system toxin AbiGii family protein [Paenibacillus sp. PK1-4R]WJM05897.1 abortive infection system toxin AbiGii family protein [Paenibacillus sp. PK1-4R]WKL02231.1 abortive infection system toxin AbiGii family protein [Paenibacillus amylolyticus]